MNEKENNIPEEEMKKLIIPKKGDLFKLLNNIPEKKEAPKRIGMERSDYVLRILRDVDINSKEIATREHSNSQLHGNLQKMYNCEALGYKLKFFEQGHQYGFDIITKGKVGFKPDEGKI